MERATDLSTISHNLYILESCENTDNNFITNRKFQICYIKILNRFIWGKIDVIFIELHM